MRNRGPGSTVRPTGPIEPDPRPTRPRVAKGLIERQLSSPPTGQVSRRTPPRLPARATPLAPQSHHRAAERMAYRRTSTPSPQSRSWINSDVLGERLVGSSLRPETRSDNRAACTLPPHGPRDNPSGTPRLRPPGAGGLAGAQGWSHLIRRAVIHAQPPRPTPSAGLKGGKGGRTPGLRHQTFASSRAPLLGSGSPWLDQRDLPDDYPERLQAPGAPAHAENR